jgi:translation initiation factor 2 subunit 3
MNSIKGQSILPLIEVKTNRTVTISLNEQQKKQGISTFALMGSVAAGKTSICKFLTGETTQKHRAELINGCTIKMGYKNLKIYYNGSELLLNPKSVPEGYNLIRHFSIADNPGHNSFMATLVTGISNIDTAIFLVSGTHGIEPQTYQHMKCFKSTEISNMAIVISKVDLVPTKHKLEEIIRSVDQLLTDENIDEDIDPPIIPMSSEKRINTDNLINYLVSQPYSKNIINDAKKEFRMTVVRSFDINKPGTSYMDLEGAVFGGSIQSGFLAVGDTICILPGDVSYQNDKIVYTPLITTVVELKSDVLKMEVALPGGFIAVKTTLDASYSKADKMVGNTIIKIDSVNDISKQCSIVNTISVSNITNLSDKELLIDHEYLLVIHASGQMGRLVSIVEDVFTFKLIYPIAIFQNDKVAILAKNSSTLEMLSYGMISDSECDDTIVLEYSDDLDEFLSIVSLQDKITDITILDDIKEIQLNKFPQLDLIGKDIHDIEKIIHNIKFDKTKFSINCESVTLHTDTTSFVISNAEKMLNAFTDDHDINTNLSINLGQFIKVSYGNDLRSANISVNNGQISFHGLRRANRKIFTNDLNKKFNEFITINFACKTCNSVGSLFFEKKRHYCRACNAVCMVK